MGKEIERRWGIEWGKEIEILREKEQQKQTDTGIVRCSER